MNETESISDLLSRVSLLLGPEKTKGPYSSPVRHLVFFTFLSNDKEPSNLWHYAHLYVFSDDKGPIEVEMGNNDLDNPYWIVHGHGPETVCSAPYLCHELGFQPRETDSPAFKYQFNLRWKAYYEKRKDENF